MCFRRMQFSVRTLLIAFGIVGALLALSIRFGPHVIWKTLHSSTSSAVVPIPSNPLIDVAPDDDLITCHVGPISFELPTSMSNNIEVHGAIGGAFVQFYDRDRSLVLRLPRPANSWLQQQITDIPDKSRLTFPRLYKEIMDAKSADFSFGMTHQELRWHTWLLANRALIGIDIELIEYVWRPDLEGNLLSQVSRRRARAGTGPAARPTTIRTFQWSTVDCKWEGTMIFKFSSPEDVDWIRHACATFAINGDPSVFQGRDDATIRSMVKMTESNNRVRRQGSDK